MATIRFLASYLKNYKLLFFTAFLILNIATLVQLVTPFIIGIIIDDLNKEQFDHINTVGSWYLLLVVICAIADYLKNYFFMRVSFAVSQDLKTDLYKNIINKDIEFFDANKTG